MAEPTAPTAPTAVSRTVASALRTVTVTNQTDLTNYLAAGGAGGMPVPTFGDQVNMTVGTYAPAGVNTLPAASSILGTATGGTGQVAATSRPAKTQAPASGTRPTASTRSAITPAGDNYISFVSANLASVTTTNGRVDVAAASNMPTCTVPSSTNGFFVVPDTTHHVRFVGLNIVSASGTRSNAGLMFQSPSADTTVSTHPNHMIVDRCLIHGDATLGMVQGVQGAGSDITIMNSRIYDVMSPGSGASSEDHGVLFASGAGPYLIHNNEITVDTIGIFVGDNSVHNTGVVPSDITITSNYIRVPAKWNGYDNQYSTGTATISSDGLTITLTGTVSAGWNDGTYYFCLLSSTSLNYSDFTNAYPNRVQPISAVSAGAGGTLTLSSAVPVGERNTSGRTFKVTKWEGKVPLGQCKNRLEVKHGNRIKVDANVFDTSPDGGQPFGINLMSLRGSGASGTDISFTNNHVKNVPGGIAISGRPTDGHGSGYDISTIAANGGLCEITTTDTHKGTTGDTVAIYGITTTTEANGLYTMTVTSSTKFTIPVTFVNAYGTNGGVTPGLLTYFRGTPAARIAITNNLFEDVGGTSVSGSQHAALNVNINPQLSPTGGANDALLSTTGVWSFDDFLFEHNTLVGPTTVSWLRNAFTALLNTASSTSGTTPWQARNFTMRNNVWKTSYASAAFTGVTCLEYNNQVTATTAGTTGLDSISDSSRQVTKNVWYEPCVASGFTVASEYATLTGNEAFPNNAYLSDYTGVGYTSHVAGTISNFALTALYSTGTATVTNGSATVTFSGTLPASPIIGKGTAFKNNANGTYYLVLSRDSNTQVTLASNYTGSTNTGAFTLGFQGWSTDGNDPGVNTTTLAAAVSGVAS